MFFFFLPEDVFCLRGVLARRGFLQEGGFGRRWVFAGGESWPEGGFGRRGVLSGDFFCPVPDVRPTENYDLHTYRFISY